MSGTKCNIDPTDLQVPLPILATSSNYTAKHQLPMQSGITYHVIEQLYHRIIMISYSITTPVLNE